jgi:hypothetical protein
MQDLTCNHSTAKLCMSCYNRAMEEMYRSDSLFANRDKMIVVILEIKLILANNGTLEKEVLDKFKELEEIIGV